MHSSLFSLHSSLKLFTSLKRHLFPSHCPICGAPLKSDEHIICLKCNIHLPRTDHFSTPYNNTLTPLFYNHPNFVKAAALITHSAPGPNANIIYSMKYHGNRQRCRNIGTLIATEAQLHNFFHEFDAIIPVPLSPEREEQRGYNQSRNIAIGVSRVTGIPILHNILCRTTFTTSQTHLSQQQRRDNVTDAFTLINRHLIAHKHILIIDDVITTGATINACIDQLSLANDVKVSVLSYAVAGR